MTELLLAIALALALWMTPAGPDGGAVLQHQIRTAAEEIVWGTTSSDCYLYWED